MFSKISKIYQNKQQTLSLSGSEGIGNLKLFGEWPCCFSEEEVIVLGLKGGKAWLVNCIHPDCMASY